MVHTVLHNLTNKFHALVECSDLEILRTMILNLDVRHVVAVFILLKDSDLELVLQDNVWIAYLAMFVLVEPQRLNQSTTLLIEVMSVPLVTIAPRIPT